MLTIVRETTLSSKDICSIALNCSKIENPVYNWNITLPKTPKPAVQPLKPPQVLFKIIDFFTMVLSFLKRERIVRVFHY